MTEETEVRLSVSVMAHPSRIFWVEELCGKLGLAWEQVAWDQERGVWDTASRAWELHDPEATHHLVLQDDALVCRDLIAGVEAGLSSRPPGQMLMSLFLGTPHPGATGLSRVRKLVAIAREVNPSWVVMPTLRWGLALVLPVNVIDAMLAWPGGAAYPADDQRIGRYCRDVLDWKCWYTWPSLVEHRPGPSLCNSGYTRARQFIGAEASALDFDWTRPVTGRRH